MTLVPESKSDPAHTGSGFKSHLRRSFSFGFHLPERAPFTSFCSAPNGREETRRFFVQINSEPKKKRTIDPALLAEIAARFRVFGVFRYTALCLCGGMASGVPRVVIFTTGVSIPVNAEESARLVVV